MRQGGESRGVAGGYEWPAPSVLPGMPAGSPVSPERTGVDGDDCNLRCLVARYPWPVAEAQAVATCESGLRADAVDPLRENWGAFQVNERTWRPFFGEERWARVLEAEENVAMAWTIYERAGQTWLPWACRP